MPKIVERQICVYCRNKYSVDSSQANQNYTYCSSRCELEGELSIVDEFDLPIDLKEAS